LNARSADGLHLSETEEGPWTVIAVRGDLDIASAPLMQERLFRHASPPAARVLLDLSECGFVDSSGLAAILHGARRLERAGGSLAVACDRISITRLLELTAIDLTIPVYDSVPAALMEGGPKLP
jgi:anti-anti-sigma factor